MASRASRLKTVLSLAHQAEQAAAQRLQEFRQQLNGERDQLAQIDAYRDQYMAAYAGRRVNVNPQELMGYSQFILRLGELRKDQLAKITRLEQQQPEYFKAWSQAHQKHKNLEELIERLIREEQLAADKRSQKVMDEFATQRFLIQREINEQQ